MTTTILNEIVAFIFGRKYYANIVNTVGTKRCEICSYIFLDKLSAQQHVKDLESTITYRYLETVSFRSRRDYTKLSTYNPS